MKKTRIEWCDSTWNPVTGCLHGCPYCYARSIAHRFDGTKMYPNGFEPMFWASRLGIPGKWKEPKNIFVCSMADLFGEWVPDEWIEHVFEACRKAPQHNYLFLTKTKSLESLDVDGIKGHVLTMLKAGCFSMVCTIRPTDRGITLSEPSFRIVSDIYNGVS